MLYHYNHNESVAYMTQTKPIDRFIHSTYLRGTGSTGQDDAVVAKMHRHQPDGTIVPELKVIRNPQRRFYVTKPGLRSQHTEKKEWEALTALEQRTCANKDLGTEVFKALHGFFPSNPPILRKLYESPYLYGADISIESLIKYATNKAFDKSDANPGPLTTGMFDVEGSMLAHNQGQLIMATISHENQFYTSVLRSNFFVVDEKGNRKPGNLEDLEKMAYEHLNPDKVFKSDRVKKILKERGFKLHFHIADEPIDILRWTLGKMHENRTDFMGVWNLPYDMQSILDTCEQAGVDPAELLCPPDLPDDLKRARFVPGAKRKDEPHHRRWHWLYAPAYTQWYDAMCLYSILRIVSGMEANYTLGHILQKNDICDGKLHFVGQIPGVEDMSTQDWHRHMQTKHPYEYIVYNIFDVMSLQALEWVNNDVPGMYVLIGNSALQNFSKQTRRGADALYYSCLEKGYVTATTSSNESDDDIIKQGGAVLPPERTYQAGLYALREAPERETCIHAHVSDIDLSAIYPTIDMACNISRETKLATMIRVLGFPDADVRLFSSLILSVTENAIAIGTKFFGLPGYHEMDELFKQSQGDGITPPPDKAT